MNNLPREILQEIGLRVRPQYRFLFRNLSRYIRSTVDYAVLFRSVSLTTREQVNYFQNHPLFARQVRNLEVQLVENNTNRRLLLRIFRNAETIRVERARGRGPQPYMRWLRDTEDAVRARPVVVHEFDHCEPIHQIVFSQLGNNLTTLYVNFSNIWTSGLTLSSFAVMPQLSTVHFRQPHFEIWQLNMMHTNCGTIQNLTLDEAQIVREIRPRLTSSYPPVNLSNLTISFLRITSAVSIGRMCQYIMEKYPRLQHINYSGEWYNHRPLNDQTVLNMLGYDDFLEFVNNIQNPVP